MPDPQTGKMITPAQRLHDLIESVELAEQVGLDVSMKMGGSWLMVER